MIGDRWQTVAYVRVLEWELNQALISLGLTETESLEKIRGLRKESKITLKNELIED